jgi:hypothetical protein
MTNEDVQQLKDEMAEAINQEIIKDLTVEMTKKMT